MLVGQVVWRALAATYSVTRGEMSKRGSGLGRVHHLSELREIAARVYVTPPFGRFDTAAEVFSIVR